MVFHQPIWKICNSQIGANETPRFGVKINMFETTTYLDNKNTSPAALWIAIMETCLLPTDTPSYPHSWHALLKNRNPQSDNESLMKLPNFQAEWKQSLNVPHWCNEDMWDQHSGLLVTQPLFLGLVLPRNGVIPDLGWQVHFHFLVVTAGN